MASSDPKSQTAEEALRESEYRYRNLFQAMAASFWELDFTPVGGMLRDLRKQGVADFAAYFADHPDFVREMMRVTRVVDVNDQTVALFGRGDKAELLRPLDIYWPEESNAVYAASVIAAVTGKPSYASETRLRKLNGEVFDALFTACFAPEAVGAGKLLIGVIDISERVQAHAMLRQVQAEFAHAARVSMLGELTASIAHEVNQPLAAIATTRPPACAGWIVLSPISLRCALLPSASSLTRSVQRTLSHAFAIWLATAPLKLRRCLSTASLKRGCCSWRTNCRAKALH